MYKRIVALTLCMFLTGCGPSGDIAQETVTEAAQAEAEAAIPVPTPTITPVPASTPEPEVLSYEERIQVIMNAVEATEEQAAAIDSICHDIGFTIQEMAWDGRGPFDNREGLGPFDETNDSGIAYYIYDTLDTENKNYKLIIDVDTKELAVVMGSDGRDLYGDSLSLLGQ